MSAVLRLLLLAHDTFHTFMNYCPCCYLINSQLTQVTSSCKLTEINVSCWFSATVDCVFRSNWTLWLLWSWNKKQNIWDWFGGICMKKDAITAKTYTLCKLHKMDLISWCFHSKMKLNFSTVFVLWLGGGRGSRWRMNNTSINLQWKPCMSTVA